MKSNYTTFIAISSGNGWAKGTDAKKTIKECVQHSYGDYLKICLYYVDSETTVSEVDGGLSYNPVNPPLKIGYFNSVGKLIEKPE